VPAALAISAVAPWAITPLLMLGGWFLCFEGFEKVAHKLLHKKEDDDAHHAQVVAARAKPEVDLVALEKEKIKGAVRTDFILSAEIIVISLGTVAAASFMNQVAVLVAIALVMTVGVYGLVAGIVKLDDAGLALSKRSSSGAQALGRAILAGAPYLMKGLSIAGTAAMFLVGGGILVHGIPGLEPAVHGVVGDTGLLAAIGPTLVNALVGIVAGGLAVAILVGVKKVLPAKKA
jgi:predicted DNA repair protein MutK